MDYIKEDLVKEFINRLPPLRLPKEVYLQVIMSRKKKAKAMMFNENSVQDLMMKREIIFFGNHWKDRYFTSVHNLAVLQHAGIFKVNKKFAKPEDLALTVPPQAQGILAVITSRDTAKALTIFEKWKAEILSQALSDNAEAWRTQKALELARLPVEYFSILHKPECKVTYSKESGFQTFRPITIDVDQPDKAPLKGVQDLTSAIPTWMTTETCRGYHHILDLSKPSDAAHFYFGESGKSVLHQLEEKYGIPHENKHLKHKKPTKGDEVMHIMKDSQEPIAGTLYYRERDEKHYVEILQ